MPHKECRKRTWRSLGGVIVKQIDHLSFSRRLRSSLQDVRVLRGADVGSGQDLLMAKVRLKIAKVRKGESGRVRFEVRKLKDLELNIRTGRITRIEIRNTVKKLKNGKTAGCDNIPPKEIKVGGETSAEFLLDLCNRIWREEKIPKEWKKGLLGILPASFGFARNTTVFQSI